MTSPPKPSLSERMDIVATAHYDAGERVSPQLLAEFATEVAALERAKREQDERLAGLENGPKGMRYHAGIAYSAGRFDLGDMYHAWADELHAATKGED